MTLKEKLETIKGKYKNYSFNMSIVNEYHDCVVVTSDIYNKELRKVITIEFCDFSKTIDYIIYYIESQIDEMIDEKVKLSFNDVNAILDDKYGKDNWVIE